MLGTPFTVTVDMLDGCTTGESAHDRAATIKQLPNPFAKASDFGKPGHINPLYAQDGGVLARPRHSEAVIDLCKLASLYPAGALMEIMNEDGTMAHLPELIEISNKYNIRIITIQSLIEYRIKNNI